MTTPRLELLFPTPVVITKIEKHQEYKDRVLPLITKKYKDSPNQTAPWARMEHTWTSFEKDEGLHIWDEQFEKVVYDYLNYMNGSPIEWKINIDSWINVHDSNMYMEQHKHGGAVCSGIYYLQFDKDKDYPAIFNNPAENDLEHWAGLESDFEPKIPALYKSTYPNYLNLEEGDLILFPPYLTHLVKRSRHQHDKLRISYAFNVENYTHIIK